MNLEIEAKMKLDDPAMLIARLASDVGPPIEEIIQQDTFFDTSDEQLRSGDAGLRLRVVNSVDEPEHREAIITYKGARQAGDLKRREEIEVSVGDAGHAARLLRGLGYVERLRFTKRRTRWRVNGCAVDLDQVPYLGYFVEIEGPTDQAVMAVREQLGLEELPLIRDGYVQMLAAYLAEHGIADRRIDFETCEA